MGNKPAEQRCETFADLIAEGVKILAELRRLEAHKRLSAEAFRALAAGSAGKHAPIVAHVEAALAKADIPDVTAFVSRLVREMSEPNWVVPPPKNRFAKVLAIYGRPGTLAGLNALKLDLGEVIAYCAIEATRQHPDRFGTIEDWQAHVDALDLARDQLAGLCRQLARSWTLEDIVLSVDGLTDGERRRGLVKACFKGAENLNLGMPDWPLRLIEIAAAERGNRRSKSNAESPDPPPKPNGGIVRRRLSSPEIAA